MTDVSGNTTPGDDGNPNLARAKNAGLFPRTRWSLVRRAAIVHTALGDWLGSYWYPLYAWARKRGASPEDAADGVQGFEKSGRRAVFEALLPALESPLEEVTYEQLAPSLGVTGVALR